LKKVVVTGATGFIGRHCLPLLLERGYEIHAFSRQGQPTDEDGAIKRYKIDLLGASRLEGLLAEIRPSHLLHLAWYVEPGKWPDSHENFRWVQTSLDLLLAFLRSGGQRAVLAGSCAEYDWRHSYCAEDITPLNPQSTYGICKNSLQEMFAHLTAAGELSGAWGRIFFLYGPHEHPARLVPSVIRCLFAGKAAECTHGNQIRDYLYVMDIADAFVSLLESDFIGPVNIASGRPTTLKKMIHTIAEKFDRLDLVRLGAIDPPENDPDLLIANTNRLSKMVGWQPTYSLEQGIEETIRWWRNQLKGQD
jgi:nucleoside-diphosphate-sugar epimerase